jgi:hypothetical protein
LQGSRAHLLEEEPADAQGNAQNQRDSKEKKHNPH